MLDEVHPELPNIGNDNNSYVLGQICGHNIVIACLPSGIYGTTSAVTVATTMVLSFTQIRFALMVGIGGVVPSQHADIRLGDVVVGTPSHDSGGVVQYDAGKSLQDGIFQRTSTVNRPPALILTALSSLQSSHMLDDSRIPGYLSEIAVRHPSLSTEFTHRGQQQDQLFEAQYEHIVGEATCDLCDLCDRSWLVARPPRARKDPVIHYGLIASGNMLMKSGKVRDKVAREWGILCFEMEAAGLMDRLPSLVIRGICDYADSHKNNQWQGYAAATAAAYAKELLSVIPRARNFQASTATTIPSGQPSGAENLSLTGDLNVQAAILRYNTGLLVQRLQAAHSELGLHQQGVLPEPTDDRSLSVFTNNNDTFLPALFAQFAGSNYRRQGFTGPSTASNFHETSPSSLAIEADPTHPRHRADFRIALLCALPLEADAVKAVFDKRWDDDGDAFGKAPRDQNAYSTGKIGRHNVVLAHMPAIGKEAAASVAANLRSSFQGVQLAIVAGICGGVPTTSTGDDIFLGDIVISEGIIPHDFGRQYPDHFARKDKMLDSLGRPNPEIRAVLAKLKSRWDHENLKAKVNRYIPILQRVLGETSLYPGASQDKLFLSSYRHKHQRLFGCDLCEACSHKTDPVCDEAVSLTCEQLNCGDDESVLRVRLSKSGANGAANEITSYEPKVHFGLVASGDVVMKSGEDRDQIARKEKVIAFEMEGAGVWDTLPCLIIKGVCDYADCHKSKRWQNYAAVSAAACMKAFLESWITNDNPVFM
jgi:nucleoside phosphorylase